MSTSDRLKAALEDFILRIASRYDYAALYPCRVVSQNGDGSLELKPDSNLLPGFSNVSMRIGIPGVTVEVAPGARVLLGFENADPSRPVATLWEAHDLTSLTITASVEVNVTAPLVNLTDAAALPVARKGDFVQVLTAAPGLVSYGQIITGQVKATV